MASAGRATALHARMREVRALWPMAVAAHVLLLVVVMLTAAPPLALGLALTAAILALGATFALRRTRLAPPRMRVRAVMLAICVGGIAALLVVLAGGPPAGEAVRAAAIGTLLIVGVAMQPARLALAAFAATVATAAALLAGSPGVLAIAAALFAIVAIGVGRLVGADIRIAGRGAAAEESERLARRLVTEYETHGTGWFWQTDAEGMVTYITERVGAELARLGRVAAGTRLVDLFRVDSGLVDTERTLTFHLASRTGFADYPVRPVCDPTADRRWSISGRPMLDDKGQFRGFIGSGSDLTAQRRAEAEITRLALFDSLTGLANRQRMRLSLDQALAPQGDGTTPTALLLLDLDRFKPVNDTLGHQAGDELLKQVAHRLLKTVGEAGLVGRLGGDEFEVVVPRERDRERLGLLAEAMIAALCEPYFIAGTCLTIGCSIGIAIAPEHGDRAEELVRHADLALYAAKADGRGVHRFYQEEMLAGARDRRRMADDLRQALAGNEFHLAYQPIVSTVAERIVGYEALLRWEHPTRGFISPADFVPVAEECGLIERIGEWVLRTACAEAAAWPDIVRVAINVSPIQFANPALPAIVTNAVAQAGIAPERIELEVTEGVFLADGAASDQAFRSLKNVGVRLALDDFGTGLSSLGYVKRAPFDRIKIDRSFVRGAIQPGSRNAAIVRAIVTLADTLGMETTAEGVERAEEVALIRELGCSHIQGFVYGRPGRTRDVLAQLAAAGSPPTMPEGHQLSRPARIATRRTARLAIGERTGDVRVRDISSGGAMIDGVDLTSDAVGVDVLIELIEDQLLPARIRWAEDGRAGLEFADSLDLERLTPDPARRSRTAARSAKDR